MIGEYDMQVKVAKQPRKVRKRMIYRVPLHMKSASLIAPLSPELRKEHGVKRLRVRKGDTVRIMRGRFSGLEGRVVRVSVKKGRIYVEGATITKADGREVPFPIHPSKVMITKLDLSDPKRKEIIDRKKGKEVEEVAETEA